MAGQRGGIDNLSLPDLTDLQASAHLFDGIGAADENGMDLADETHPAERFTGAYVSANAFDLIGRQPALGRGFTETDDRVGAVPTVILGHSVWQRRYAANRAALGARAGDLCWVVSRRAGVQLAVGVTLGLGGALGAGQLLQGVLFGVSSRDPLTLVGMPG